MFNGIDLPLANVEVVATISKKSWTWYLTVLRNDIQQLVMNAYILPEKVTPHILRMSQCLCWCFHFHQRIWDKSYGFLRINLSGIKFCSENIYHRVFLFFQTCKNVDLMAESPLKISHFITEIDKGHEQSLQDRYQSMIINSLWSHLIRRETHHRLPHGKTSLQLKNFPTKQKG